MNFLIGFLVGAWIVLIVRTHILARRVRHLREDVADLFDAQLNVMSAINDAVRTLGEVTEVVRLRNLTEGEK